MLTRNKEHSRSELLEEHDALTSETSSKNDQDSSGGNGSTELGSVSLDGSRGLDGEELGNSLGHLLPLDKISDGTDNFEMFRTQRVKYHFIIPITPSPTSVETIEGILEKPTKETIVAPHVKHRSVEFPQYFVPRGSICPILPYLI